jgi:hypothetical protein
MDETYTGRKLHRMAGGRLCGVEVTVRAEPSSRPTEVTVSAEADAALRRAFGADHEPHRYTVRWAVLAQIGMANGAGEMPHVGAACFRAEVVRVAVLGMPDRETALALLAAAGMNAIRDYLIAFEEDAGANPTCRPGGASGSSPG